MKTRENEEFKGYYDAPNAQVSKIFKSRIKNALELATINEKSIVLDIGCQFGHLLKFIREKKPQAKLCGIDSESYGLRNSEIENCELGVADARNMPFQNEYFDLSFAMDVLEHIDDGLNTAIKEI